MKITKHNGMKLLAIILAVSLIVANIIPSFAAVTELPFDNTVETGVEYTPVDSIMYHSTSNAAPTVSAAGEGVKGSYAMELTNTGAGLKKLYMQAASRQAITYSSTYVIGFKIRLKSGTVTTFESGVFENGDGGFMSSFSLSGSQLTNEWKYYRFEHKTNSNVSNWKRLAFHITSGAGGSVVQMDDLEMYLRAPNGTLTAVNFGNTDKATLGSFDSKLSVGETVDNTVDSSVAYLPISQIKCHSTSTVTPAVSAAGEGVKGSYAMELKSDNSGETKLYLAPNSRSILSASTTYLIKFKLRVKSGTVTNFQSGIFENGHGFFGSLRIKDTDLTDVWKQYSFEHTTNSDTGNWKRLGFHYTVGTGGAVVQLDDVEIFLKNSDGKLTPVDFVNDGQYNNGTLGSYDTKKSVPIPFDNTPDPNLEYAPIGQIKYHINTSTVTPVLSQKGEGVKGSYAMELVTTEQGDEKLYLQPYSLSVFTSNTTYVIGFKVRVKSGSVTELKSGIFENNAGGFFSSCTVDGADLSNEWQYFRFEHTTILNDGNWRRLAFHYTTGTNGATVQFDDVEVYVKNADNSLTPVDFKHDSQYNSGTIGSYDFGAVKQESLEFDNTPYPDTTNLLFEERAGAREYDVAPTISAKGDGVKGSYALEIPVNPDTFSNTITFQSGNRTNAETSLYWDTTYTVEFKIRAKSGSLSRLNVGIREVSISVADKIPNVEGGTYVDDETKNNYGKWYYPQQDNYFYSLSIVDVSDEWSYYSCQVTTNKNTANWKRLLMNFVGTSADTVIQIDDLKVYVADDPNKNLITYQNHSTGFIDAEGSFDLWRAAFTTDSVDNTSDGSKYYPIYFENWKDQYTLDANGEREYTKKITDAVPTIFNDGLGSAQAQDTYRNTIIPRLSEPGGGVKGSYAMVIGDKTVPNVSKYEVGMRYGRTNQLKDNTEYTFVLKLKKGGTVDRFKIGVRENYTEGTIHYPFQILDSELNNEWTEYSFKYTTTEKCTGGWSEIFFSYSSATGGEVYIDDVLMYVSTDAEKKQCFTWSDFDYTDLGQEEKVEFSEWPENLIKPYFNPSTNSDKTVIKADPENGIEGFAGTGNIATIENYKGNGVLKIGFNDKNSNVEYRHNLDASKPGGTYKISFKILVQGDDVQRCRVGVYNSFARYEYYNAGSDFNQYENGKWTTVSYTWTDPANYINGVGYRYFLLEFIGGAGSGVMIDDLTVTYVSDDWGGEAPNIIEYGSFGKEKKEKPNLVWSDKYTYKEEKE